MPLDRRLFNGKLQSSIVYPEFFPIQKTDRVVNLGCGVGPQVAAYAGQFQEMVCVDLSEDRLEQLKIFMVERGITGFTTLAARVEQTGLPVDSFDKALCIDIIEHLADPMAFLQEIHRLLKPGGRALVTIPVMHDHYVHLARALRRSKAKDLPEGHPDKHNSDLSRARWLQLFRQSPLTLKSIRATTLFPPLHLTGIPRFWFTNPIIHGVDRLLCQIPFVRRFGQAWMCILEKE